VPGNVGLPCPLPPGRAPGKIGRAGHSETLPGFRPVADVPGLPPGFHVGPGNVGLPCLLPPGRAPGFPHSIRRNAAQCGAPGLRRASLPGKIGRAGHAAG